MIPMRLSAKYFVQDSSSVDLPALIPVFQRWITDNPFGDLLIDVVDYKHVHHGPGIILIGHQADYALDMADGIPGLLVTQKRGPASLPEALRTLLEKSLAARRLIQTDGSIQPTVEFDAGEFVITFHDRLQFPNREETLDQIRPILDKVIGEIYGDVGWSSDREARGSRHALAIRIRVPEETHADAAV